MLILVAIVCCSLRLSYVLEQRGNSQSGFGKGPSTLDAVVRVSDEVEKTVKMKELMAIV